MNQFPDYASRRYTHWRRSYHMHNWEAIPDRVAAKVGQVPNKYKKLAGAPTSQLKGPRERVYKLPEKLEEEVRRPGSHGLYCMVYFVCVMIFFPWDNPHTVECGMLGNTHVLERGSSFFWRVCAIYCVADLQGKLFLSQMVMAPQCHVQIMFLVPTWRILLNGYVARSTRRYKRPQVKQLLPMRSF